MERYRTVTEVLNEFRELRPGVAELSDRRLVKWLDQLEGRIYTKALLLPHEDLKELDPIRRYQHVGALTAGSYHFTVPEVADGEPEKVSYGFTLDTDITETARLVWMGGATATVTDGQDTETVAVTLSASGTLIPVTDEADRLIAPEPWAAIYVQWLLAQADYACGENDRYTNDIAVVENTWRAFVTYVADRWAPANKHCGGLRRLV